TVIVLVSTSWVTAHAQTGYQMYCLRVNNWDKGVFHTGIFDPPRRFLRRSVAETEEAAKDAYTGWLLDHRMSISYAGCTYAPVAQLQERLRAVDRNTQNPRSRIYNYTVDNDYWPYFPHPNPDH